MPAHEVSDPRWEPSQLNAYEKLFLPYMRDERDMIFIRTSTAMVLTVWPAAALVWGSAWMAWWAPLALMAPYLATLFALGAGRYTLMLHATSHRRLFKNRYSNANAFIPWAIGPFFGHTPTSFYTHHIGMHHPENNMESDLSSTLAYKRDELSHFLHYWARFFFVGLFHLLNYFRLRERDQHFKRMLTGELAWLIGVAALMVINPTGTFAVLVMPLLMMRFFMMSGNWAQHAFVDLRDPNNGFLNSTCLTNSPYNHKCYNDGYHIVHHEHAGMHWSEMAQWFVDNQDAFREHNSLVFSAVGNNQSVWWLLMTKNYTKLAEHLVDLGEPRTIEEKVALLKSRVHGTRGEIPGLFSFETEVPSEALPVAAK